MDTSEFQFGVLLFSPQLWGCFFQQMSFLNRRRSRNRADNCGTVPQIYECQRQRKDEQQPSSHLVHRGMHRYERFLPDISCCDIRRLNGCDDGDPYTEPGRNTQYRKHFYQANRDEYDICDRIQPRTELADGTGFPRHSPIDHIGSSSCYVEHKKRRGKRRAEQQKGADRDSGSGYDVCHFLSGNAFPFANPAADNSWLCTRILCRFLAPVPLSSFRASINASLLARICTKPQPLLYHNMRLLSTVYLRLCLFAWWQDIGKNIAATLPLYGVMGEERRDIRDALFPSVLLFCQGSELFIEFCFGHNSSLSNWNLSFCRYISYRYHSPLIL